jgi:hypothetical protein
MARARVTIDSGELPSAVGKSGSELTRVVHSWQGIAAREFRNNCRFLKQMIAETDELRLWEKNVAGFTFKDRDDFLRNEVLINYELTERDMTEIVAALKHDDIATVQARLRDKAGRPKKDERNGSPTTIIGRGKAYQEERLKRDFPEIWTAFENGEFKSIKAATIAAGIVKPPTPLDTLRKAWRKASPSERAAFLTEITDKGTMQ